MKFNYCPLAPLLEPGHFATLLFIIRLLTQIDGVDFNEKDFNFPEKFFLRFVTELLYETFRFWRQMFSVFSISREFNNQRREIKTFKQNSSIHRNSSKKSIKSYINSNERRRWRVNS